MTAKVRQTCITFGFGSYRLPVGGKSSLFYRAHNSLGFTKGS